MQSEQNPQTSSQESSIRRFSADKLVKLPSSDDEGGVKLGSIFLSLWRHLPIIVGVTFAVTSLALFRAFTSKGTYQAGFQILAKPITEENRVISYITLKTLTERGESGEKSKILPATIRLLKSPRILNPIVEQLKSSYPSVSYESLASDLVVKALPEPESEILSVSYEDQDPLKVKAILELVSKAYLDYSLEERLVDIQQGIEFVETQLPQVQERVDKLQDQLQNFRQQYNLIDPDASSKLLAGETSTISLQRLENQVKLNEARSLFLDFNRQLTEPNNGIKASSLLQENARYQTLLTQIQVLESQIVKELSVFRENTDRIQALRDQKVNLMPLLIEEEEKIRELLASRIRELESREAILAQSEQQLNQQVKQLSVISRQYGDIQLGIKISSDNLNQFLTKREALRIDAGQRKIPWQILTPLNTPVRSTSDVKRDGALGGILGLLLGIGIALLLNKLSDVLRTSDEVKDIVKLPILGVIPFVILDDYQDEFFANPNRAFEKNEDQGFISHLKKIMHQILLMNPFQKKSKEEIIPKYPYHIKSIFLEEFRMLYTNICLLSPDDEIRSIVISSSVMGEGKSTTSAYLAQAAAALGKRVLLVDADLRRPSLHDKLELTNTLGLCNLISTNLSFDQVIQKSPLEPNLSILTSGQIPPDPSRLLSSQKMQSLMNLFSETYDLVIYDTPPLLGIVDAKLIAAKTDGIIMVVGLDKTKASILTQAMDLLDSSPITVFGLIANGAKDYAASLNRIYTRF